MRQKLNHGKHPKALERQSSDNHGVEFAEETKSQRNPHLNAHKIKINMINKVFNLLSLITFGERAESKKPQSDCVHDGCRQKNNRERERESASTTKTKISKLKLMFACDAEISIAYIKNQQKQQPNNLFIIPIWVRCVVTLSEFISVALGSFMAC